ncbi:RAI1-domain-containing protein [Lophiostoma macrostomum CBS 122681]|uniref:Decapping nuclease n=1 Tax=Lophiostoma macrostomum CBS 122681 TaxID=1314788 RepID=A0A6A6T3Y2_9PLEO|nr:RAI1-domain-containing protein [Lophiostoma macrostomum CBS 122681]
MSQKRPGAASSLPPRPPAPPDTSSIHPTPERDPTPPRKRRRVDHMPFLASSDPIRFPIQPLSRFQGASASIKRPREIAYFSYDENHEYREDDSGISYYCPPQIGANLCDGFDTFRHYEDKEDPHLNSLLRTLVSQEKRTGERVQADFVTWRGMMTKIMTAPFDMFAAFDMFATLHDGTIYIEEDFETRAAERAAESAANSRGPPRPPNRHQPDHKMMTYWGYKFETLSMLPDTPENTSQDFIANRPKAPVSNHAQHCSIVRTAFGSSSLILGGEVDGLSDPKPSNPDLPIPWVELKTAEELPLRPQHRDILKYERKLLKFWAQSFLLGVPKVIVGFRSKQGVLRSIDVYETGKIPGMVRRGTACWDGNVCINFAAGFLQFLKDTVKGEGVYKITLRKKGGVVEVCKVQEKGTGDILCSEFLEWRGKGNGTGDDGEVGVDDTQRENEGEGKVVDDGIRVTQHQAVLS